MSDTAKIAVLGASGEIGARLVQRLIREGRPVRAVARRPGIRLSRWKDLDFRATDWSDRQALINALSGCETLINCAVTKDDKATDPDLLAANRLGMRNLLEAAAAVGIRRIIHLSSIAVLPRRITKEVLDNPYIYSSERDWYTLVKIEAERMALERHDDLHLTVVRPGVVYGPHMAWSERAFSSTPEHPTLLPSASGICPAVHVDDVVGLCLHLARQGDTGARLVHAVHPEHPTWEHFFRRHVEGARQGSEASNRCVHVLDALSLAVSSPSLPRGPNLKSILRWLWMSPLWHPALADKAFLAGFKRRFQAGSREFQPTICRDGAQAPNYLDMELFQSTGIFGPDSNGVDLGYAYRTGFPEGVAKAAAWWRPRE